MEIKGVVVNLFLDMLFSGTMWDSFDFEFQFFEKYLMNHVSKSLNLTDGLILYEETLDQIGEQRLAVNF